MKGRQKGAGLGMLTGSARRNSCKPRWLCRSLSVNLGKLLSLTRFGPFIHTTGIRIISAINCASQYVSQHYYPHEINGGTERHSSLPRPLPRAGYSQNPGLQLPKSSPMLLRLLWAAGGGAQWAADGQGGKPADPCTRTWGVPSAFLRLPGA